MPMFTTNHTTQGNPSSPLALPGMRGDRTGQLSLGCYTHDMAMDQSMVEGQAGVFNGQAQDA